MNKVTRKSSAVVIVGSMLITYSQFIYLPVFAEGPMKISIIEVVDGESGGYKPWEDITGAMPGEVYSAIPQVRNDGSIPAMVRMCLSESAKNAAGEVISLRANAFGIAIGDKWVLDDNSISSPDNPMAGNCYRYSSMLEVGMATEPLFREVVLNTALENEYQGATFGLHLEAEAWDYIPESAPSKPDAPNTGVNTFSYLANISPVLLSAGAIMLFALVAYVIKSLVKRK